MSEILVVPTGTANTASVLAALRRAGGEPQLCGEPHRVARASHVVLPGVGSFGAASSRLDRHLRNALRRRIEEDRATLGICLGMQLLCLSSEETPGARGLAVVPGVVRRLPDGRPLPQIGWNRVEAAEGCELLESGEAYFANGYALQSPPRHWNVASTDYGVPFVSALELGAVLACQFHPELSGSFGQALLQRWIRKGAISC
ncbi:MAG: imidazole glycerol phosphate synthase subunit HisH [Planctomycetota bacterium]